ncbi:MAG TPA: toxin [Gammaproteobacteria bacterium]|nr:toxin [Gammaproteobacteria bacterium]
MANFQQKTSNQPENTSGIEPNNDQISPPSIALPKGGGAIRGMGEKFAANPVTGSGSITIPVATSPGRSGFGSQLSLAYDSASGNGPYGFGWSLSLSSITRKTDKGLPTYQDTTESDVFILSGAEDLVPVLTQQGSQWIRESQPPRTVDGKNYIIQRYRPRIEGLFACIERWINQADPTDIFWRSISKDNITTWYGRTKESRIADPADPSRIFSWLICESYDDKGNVIVYGYKKEDSAQIATAQAHECNRNGETRSANRYLKYIRYGNHRPYFPELVPTDPWPVVSGDDEWRFEVVFDYGEHDFDNPIPADNGTWTRRNDPFSSYRSGFEIRTYRLCQRILMFHHFPAEPDIGQDCLVRSTDFTYSYEDNAQDPRDSTFSFLTTVTQTRYRRKPDGGYVTKALPPIEFEYTQPTIDETVHEVDAESLENLPYGVDGTNYQWLDLDGEGLSGIMSEQAAGWFYKRNLSPITVKQENGKPVSVATFGSVETVTVKPSLAAIGGGRQQFLDLAGDGQLDLVDLQGPTPGFFERTHDGQWKGLTPFTSLPNLDWSNPNLRFVDLTGDGHADVLISEQEVFTWHRSLAEQGFGQAEHVPKSLNEEKGPRVVLADRTESIYLADMSGDGLTDLVRLRNGEVCYWPNLGYGRFGAKVTMDKAPWFDAPDLFDPRRIRLGDIDGSGITDILYLDQEGVQLYLNESGNGWSERRALSVFPKVDNLASIQAVDLLGNGTVCLVWSSSLPHQASRSMQYVDLMGGQKPHLLVKTSNNLGAETVVQYAPSTKYYLQDQQDGKPWITRIPFPVHVVERVETYDHISKNHFVSRYAYHHGYFDGIEREFRGFGMVEQWDTEGFASFGSLSPNEGESQSGGKPATNIDAASHAPPVYTKTWFHTGAYLDRRHISNYFAGLIDVQDIGEYYREPGLNDDEARQLLLDDTVLPAGLTVAEERQACRALKGAMLRQEVYALDGTEKAPHPYTVTEQNFTIKCLQREAGNRHAVFFTHAREVLGYQYERNTEDPRIGHTLTLEVDDFGNVLKSAAIGYGRRQLDMNLSAEDQATQARTLITYTENRVTNAIRADDDYRASLPCEICTFELTGYVPTGPGGRLRISDLVHADPANSGDGKQIHLFDGEIDYGNEPPDGRQRRLIEHLRTLYRPDDLGVAQNDPLALLPLGILESQALPGENHKLAFTPELVTRIYGAKVTDPMLVEEGRYIHSEGDTNWWLSSGRVFLSPHTNDDPATELSYARDHFFLPYRFRNPFHREGFETEHVIAYDADNLFVTRMRDALGNSVTAEHDYRVLQTRLMTDPNGNRSEVAFDTLGMIVGTAVMGKKSENKGDSLVGFNPDPDEATLLAHLENPLADPHLILQHATTRLVYDLFAYVRTKDQPQPQPAVVYALARETHHADLGFGEQTRIQHSFSYSDGFGREIQKKIQAEPGPIMEGGQAISPRWAGTGWTVFNSKGKPVRQYEPFFTATHRFEFNVRAGVSPILFYDPLQRVVATLNPDHTWQKIVFDVWRQESWDVNDTVLIENPKNDPDVGDFFKRLPEADYLPTWYGARIDGANGEQKKAAARKTEHHANTPAVAHMDSLGRSFLSVGHNRFERKNNDGSSDIVEEKYSTRLVFDIEGDQREVIDAKDRAVMRYDYDMLGNQIRSTSMDTGERWMLNDIAGRPIRAWDTRGHEFRTEYDQLQRPVRQFVRGVDAARSDPRVVNREVLFQKTEYGEGQTDDIALNLRTRVWKSHDTAGTVTSEVYDFKGNPLRGTRQLTVDYKNTVDWSASVDLEPEVFASSTTYDALNRAISLITPDNSEIVPTYNEANLLEQVKARILGAAGWTTFIAGIDYNAKGQRELIEYGNTVKTTYEYDPLTFRLIQLSTTKSANGDLQHLSYTYDPIGNITHIQDETQQTSYFNNTVVEPHADYSYDAIYRLITATGREQTGQTGQVDHNDPTPRPHPGDGQAMRPYTEQYEYDGIGNILKMIHQANGGSWTRHYDYAVGNNRLLATSLPGDDPAGSYSGKYDYNEHGSMAGMPHLPVMAWDFAERLQASAKQVVNGGTPEMTYYAYDAAGHRVRKVTERQAAADELPTRMKERIYLGEFEFYRTYAGNGIDITLERETLHVMDGQQRIAMVETKTIDSTSPLTSAVSRIRYQLSNHLGSASLELDDTGQVISYEEYHPFGTTSYHAVNSAIDVSLKRYRYTGKEKDEETGLHDHGARYYACWLGRWISTDPSGIADGLCIFAYTKNNPVNFRDPNGKESFNAGKIMGYETIDGIEYMRFQATEGTWISATMKELGWDHQFTKEEGYGAYVPDLIRESSGIAFNYPDVLEVGQEYLIPTVDQRSSQPEIVPEPKETPEPEGWGKFIFRNAVDLVFPDKVTVEGHVGGGVEAMEVAGGIQSVVEGGLAGTLITNPNSPDFLKVSLNPTVGGSSGLKVGAGQTITGVTPVGVGGVSITMGEFFGSSSGATIGSLKGFSGGGYFGAEGKAFVGLSGAVVASVAMPNEGLATWGEGGFDIQGRGSGTFNATGEGGLSYKYTAPSIWSKDLLPDSARRIHAQYVDWLQGP